MNSIFMFALNRIVARRTFTVDWKMPASMSSKLRSVCLPQDLYGRDVDVLWLAPRSWESPHLDVVSDRVKARGGIIKHSSEFNVQPYVIQPERSIPLDPMPRLDTGPGGYGAEGRRQ